MAARRNWSPDEVDRVVAFVLADATNREIGDLLDADHSTIVRLRRRPDVAARIDVARARVQSDADRTAARRARADERERDRQRADRDAYFERRASGQPPPVPDEQATSPEFRPVILDHGGNRREALTDDPREEPPRETPRTTMLVEEEDPWIRRRRRSRRAVQLQQALSRLVPSPLEMEAARHAQREPYSLASFLPTEPPEDWLDGLARQVPLRDPSGRRWLRVTPGTEEHREALADGWLP